MNNPPAVASMAMASRRGNRPVAAPTFDSPGGMLMTSDATPSPSSMTTYRPAIWPLRAQLIVGGYITIVTWWLRSGAKHTSDAVEAAFRTIAASGLAR